MILSLTVAVLVGGGVYLLLQRSLLLGTAMAQPLPYIRQLGSHPFELIKYCQRGAAERQRRARGRCFIM